MPRLLAVPAYSSMRQQLYAHPIILEPHRQGASSHSMQYVFSWVSFMGGFAWKA